MAEPTAATLDPAGLSGENATTLDRLVRAVDMAEGFALFIARCNVPALSRQLMDRAKQQLGVLGVPVVEIVLEGPTTDLRARLREELQALTMDLSSVVPISQATREPATVREPSAPYHAPPKRALFVTGLEYSIPYDRPNSRILAELNLGRDFFPHDVPHPLVLWLPDYAVTAIARHAPDFWAWRSGVFEFETGEAERNAAFRQTVWSGQPWHTLTNLTPEARLLRRRQLESLLDDYRDLRDDPRAIKERADILHSLGDICSASQDYNGAIAYYRQALELWRPVGDRVGEAATLSNMGSVYDALGEKQQALACYQQALSLRRQVGDRAGEAVTLNNIGGVFDVVGEKQRALAYYQRALPLFGQVGDRAGEAVTLNNIGLVYFALGEQQQALAYYQQALPLRRDVGDRAGEAVTLNNIGGVYDVLGEKQQALVYYQQALLLSSLVGDRWGESITHYNMAMVYRSLGRLDEAEIQLAAAVALDEATGHPDLASDRAALEEIRAARRAQASGS